MSDILRIVLTPLFWLGGLLVNLLSEARILRIRIGQVLVIALVVLGFLVWRGWRTPPVEPAGPVDSRAALATGIAAAVDNLLGNLPRPTVAFVPTLVLPLRGDREALVGQELSERLRAQGWYLPVDSGTAAGAVSSLRARLEGWWNGTRSSPDSLARAREMARGVGAEVVILGSVERLEFERDWSKVVVHVTVMRAGDGSILFDGDVSNDSPTPAASFSWRWFAGATFVAGGVLAAAVLFARVFIL